MFSASVDALKNITFGEGAFILLKYTGWVVLAILCIMLVYSVTLIWRSPRFRWSLVGALHLPDDFRDLFRSGKEESEEYSTRRKAYLEIKPDHDAFASRILDCMKANRDTAVPADVGDLLDLSGYYFSIGEPYSGGSRAPYREERAILLLSKTIGVRRIQLSERVSSTYRFWQVASLISILLGMLTTIVVSMSTTDFGHGDTPTAVLIRLCAIILPALSTAAAAAFAFYGPQTTWAQATRTLTSLAQLHGQIALEVWGLDPADSEEGKNKMSSALDGWSKRYLDIQTISSAAAQGSPPQGSGGGQSGGQGLGGGQSGGQQGREGAGRSI
jgi:hypothetical protein